MKNLFPKADFSVPPLLIEDRQFWEFVKRQHTKERTFAEALDLIAQGKIVTDLVWGSGRLATLEEALKAAELQARYIGWIDNSEFYQAVCDLLRPPKEFY